MYAESWLKSPPSHHPFTTHPYQWLISSLPKVALNMLNTPEEYPETAFSLDPQPLPFRDAAFAVDKCQEEPPFAEVEQGHFMLLEEVTKDA